MRTVFLALVIVMLGNHAEAKTLRVTTNPPHFTDVSIPVGLGGLRRSTTYSAAVADYNLDGYIDILISHHNRLSLWTNNHGVSFKNSTSIIDFNRGDLHGVSFIDINNDGYPDILVACGADRGRGVGRNLILINNQGRKFTRLSPAPKLISDIFGRGRTITPTDLNADGLIDLLIFNYYQTNRPNILALQTGNGIDFQNYDPGGKLSSVKSFAMKVVDFNNNGHRYFIATGPGIDSGKIYSQHGNHFQEVSRELGIKESNASCLPFDYDNDGDLDLLCSHHNFSKPTGADLYRGEIRFNYIGSHARKYFKAFGVKGGITINIHFEEKQGVGPLFLGEYARRAKNNPWHGQITSTQIFGKPQMDANSKAGAYIWSDAKGYLNFSYIGSPSLRNISGYISADKDGFTSIKSFPARAQPQLIENSFYENVKGHFVKKSAQQMGLAGRGLAKDTIAADFNNDGLVDIYQVNIGCSFNDTNPGNELFINNGDGTFSDKTMVTNTFGPHEGAGNGAIAFDYDNDGDLDLLLYNGFVRFPVKPGPIVLLRNDTKSKNNSISIELKGTSSNSRGWGSRILCNTNNKKRQYQQKSGLNGYLSTSDKPFHFGLGRNKIAQQIEIVWPSGKKQVLHNVKAGSRMLLSEP